MFFGLLRQEAQVAKVIPFGEEACPAVIASLNDVPRHICDSQSRSSWHLEFLFDVALRISEYKFAWTG
jgi:hypothetical protein